MEQSQSFGVLTGHAIGTIIKSAMLRAIEHISAKQFTFEAKQKDNLYKPDKEDFVTDADVGAQRVYVKLFRESFPLFGIVAEEAELSVPCTHPDLDIWLTVDPLDGTKAFIRGQSHGVGTMVSLVCNGEIIAAYVGDVMTGEIYGYRPGSEKVHRINSSGLATKLAVEKSRNLHDQYVLLRDEPWKHSDFIKKLSGPVSDGGLFKGMLIDGGSIGIGLARLWKGEVGALVLSPGNHTPWDSCPVNGITQKLGFLRVCFPHPNSPHPFVAPNASPSKQVQPVETETVLIHSSRIDEFDAWCRRQGILP